jgi:hypothetical protein
MRGCTEESEFAKELGVELITLQKKRRKAMLIGKPLVPPFVEIARKFYYPNAQKAEWLKSNMQIPGGARRRPT